jgi:hypothetical protein
MSATRIEAATAGERKSIPRRMMFESVQEVNEYECEGGCGGEGE